MKFSSLILSSVLAATFGWHAVAQDFTTVSVAAKADLERALSELAALQKQVGAERIPLAQQLGAAEESVLTKRKDYEKLQRTRDNDLVELNVLKDQVKKKKDELEYVNGLLQEFASLFESRIHISELQVYQPQVQAVRQQAGDQELSLEQRLTAQFGLLEVASARIDLLTGGHAFEGSALSPAGTREKGKIVLLGPVAVFASTGSPTAGTVERQVGSLEPSVLGIDPQLTPALQQFVNTGNGGLPFDATMGNAIKLAAMNKGIYHKLAEGGLVMIPLLTLGLAAVLVALVKWIQFSRMRLATEADVHKVLRLVENEEPDKAMAYASSIKGPAGQLLVTAIQHVDEKKEYIEEVLYEKMLGARIKVERGLAFLALSATTGPLMGLLGTVMGMIATFKLISSHGSGDPKLLAAGISEALIATATGMAVAIPSLLLHAFLSRKAKGIIGSMEQTAVGFINGVQDGEKSLFDAKAAGQRD